MKTISPTPAKMKLKNNFFIKMCYVLMLFSGMAFGQIVNIPDANFKAVLLSASPSNSIACNSLNMPIKIDVNNDGEIQNSEALAVKTLSVFNNYINDLTGIQFFLNLEELRCYQNNLSSLDVSSLSNLKLLKCSENNMSSLNISGLTQIETLDFNVNLISSINLNSAVNLKNLICYHNSLSNLDVSQNTLLETIWADTNQLSTLNLVGLNNLTTLYVNENQLTSLNLTVINSLIEIQCRNNLLTLLDLSTLVNLSTLICGGNQIATLDLSNQHLNQLACENNLLITLDISNSLGLGQLYFGNTGLNAVDLSGFTNLTHLYFYGGNQTAINISNLPLLVDVGLINTNLTSIDISNNPLIFNLYLNNNNNLNYLNIKNGGNVSSGVNSCPNLLYVCANESDIINLNQAISNGINNSASTVVNSYCSFTPGGNHNTITGSIKFDANNDGCDANDLPQSNIRVNINDGATTGATFTNNLGNYTFYTQAGSFDLTPDIENPTWYTFSPTTATIPFADNNNNTTNQNFCITANGVHNDVEVVVEPILLARPGFDAIYKIVYKNKGNQTLSGALSFGYDDSVLDFVSATVVPTSQSTGLLNWNYTNMLPFENRSFYVTLHVNTPTSTPPVNIGDSLTFNATITPIITDENPLDNTFTFNQTVVGSFDPNNIACLEGAVVPPSEIGSYLHYGVNFENTGTSQAQNIVVKVVIDTTKYDVNSLQMLNTSNPAYIKITGNVAEFIFQNIMLDTGGHGDVLFKIKTLSSLNAGDMVTKAADIFFDYNAPINTGMANTTFELLNNGQFVIDNSIIISPNPTSSLINVNSNINIKSVQVYDIQGRLLETKLVNDLKTIINLLDKTNGIYFLKITTDTGSKVEKIVKE